MTPDEARETEQQRLQGPEAYLSSEERKNLQRLLSFPEDLPKKFREWLIDYLTVNPPQFSITQIQGFEKYLYRKGTELPQSPRDGQQFAFVADSNNGIVWRFQYNADSGSQYKWEFVGGAPIYLAVDATVSTTSSSPQDLGGPNVTVPLAGQYTCMFGAEFDCNVADKDTIAGVWDGSAVQGEIVMEAIPDRRIALSKAVVITVANPNTSIGLRYRLGTAEGHVGNWQRRWLMVSPVRVK